MASHTGQLNQKYLSIYTFRVLYITLITKKINRMSIKEMNFQRMKIYYALKIGIDKIDYLL